MPAKALLWAMELSILVVIGAPTMSASVVLNGFIAVMSVLAWLQIWRGTDDATLAHRGPSSLKYYTVLSNLFSGAVSAVYLLAFLLPGRTASIAMLAFRLAAAAVVMVTFLVTALLLVPQYGWRSLYQGGNFWMHLVLPLMALVDAIVFARVGTLPLSATWVSVVFTALYSIGYVRPIYQHGAEKDGVVYDFYGFLRWGEDKILLVGTIMLFATWGITLACWMASRLIMGV